MKRVFFLAMMILIVVSFTIAKTPVMAIANDDLKDLQGDWTGERERQGIYAKTDLRISNDSLPLRGELELHFPRIASKTWRFNNGQFENGRLTIVWDKNRSLDLRLRKKGAKMELKGHITTMGYRGAVVLKKVQK